MDRPDALVTLLAEATRALAGITGPAAPLATELVTRMAKKAGPIASSPHLLPACDRIAPAVHTNGTALARAVRDLAPLLAWTRTAHTVDQSGPFWDGHANAVILGKSGFETRDDVWIGVSVMAPNLTYPQHSHPPAEIYLPLSEGEWWNDQMDWTNPGSGGFIYNPPAVLHSMRSGASPLLALWFLPL